MEGTYVQFNRARLTDAQLAAWRHVETSFGDGQGQALADALRILGDYGCSSEMGIEAQVHGPIDLGRDVERIVADPSFARTHTGDQLNELARKYGLPIDWHPGFCLEAREVSAEFRGPAIPKLARRIAADGLIDAAVIGAAQRSLRLQPDDWLGWGEHGDILQHLKQLWHVLVHYGRPENRH